MNTQQTNKVSIKSWLILIISGIGTINAIYLSYLHLVESNSCSSINDCHAVLSSEYSEFWGIPLAIVGVGTYLSLTYLSLSLWIKKSYPTLLIFKSISLIGSLISLYLVYLQAFVIGHWCQYCLFSALNMFLLLYLSLNKKGFDNDDSTHSDRLLILFSIACLFLTPILISKAILKQTNSNSSTVAIVNGQEFSLYTMEDELKISNHRAALTQYHRERKWFGDKLFTLESENEKISLDAYIKKEIDHKYPPAERLFARERLIDSLAKKYDAKFFRLKPAPLELGIHPNPRGGPELGPKDAKVTIIEFIDFQCPQCRMLQQHLKKLIQLFPKDLRVVFRHLPMEAHPYAMLAAEMSVCAQEQGVFWEYADKVFTSQRILSEDTLTRLAKELQLDEKLWKNCISSGNANKKVQTDLQEASALGIYSTPLLLINGKFYGQLPTEEHIRELIASQSKTN